MEGARPANACLGFHLYGHSGGANLVAALLGLRRDLACTVPADGKLAGSGKSTVSDPALQVFWASDAIPNIARNHAARIIVVIDPQDRIVPISNQLPFVEKLRRAGGKVEVFFIDSGGDEHADHHATTGHAALVMRECVRGASHDNIAAGLALGANVRIHKSGCQVKAWGLRSTRCLDPSSIRDFTSTLQRCLLPLRKERLLSAPLTVATWSAYLGKITVPPEPISESSCASHTFGDQCLTSIIPFLDQRFANTKSMALNGRASIGADTYLRKTCYFLRHRLRLRTCTSLRCKVFAQSDG